MGNKLGTNNATPSSAPNNDTATAEPDVSESDESSTRSESEDICEAAAKAPADTTRATPASTRRTASQFGQKETIVGSGNIQWLDEDQEQQQKVVKPRTARIYQQAIVNEQPQHRVRLRPMRRERMPPDASRKLNVVKTIYRIGGHIQDPKRPNDRQAKLLIAPNTPLPPDLMPLTPARSAISSSTPKTPS